MEREARPQPDIQDDHPRPSKTRRTYQLGIAMVAFLGVIIAFSIANRNPGDSGALFNLVSSIASMLIILDGQFAP